jgi:hypothetical protein
MIAAVKAGHTQVPMHPVRIGAGVTRAGDAPCGELFVQGRVARGATSGLFDDVVGRGWTLVSRDPAMRLDGEAAAFFGRSAGSPPTSRPTVRCGIWTACTTAGSPSRAWRPSCSDPTSTSFGTAATLDDVNELVLALRDAFADA